VEIQWENGETKNGIGIYSVFETEKSRAGFEKQIGAY